MREDLFHDDLSYKDKFPVMDGDIDKLEREFSKPNHFYPAEANREMLELYDRFRRVNLAPLALHLALKERDESGKDALALLTKQNTAREQYFRLDSEHTLLQIQNLINPNDRQKAREIEQRVRCVKKEKKAAWRAYTALTSSSNNSWDRYFQNFDRQHSKFNYFGIRFRARFLGLRCGLFLAAVGVSTGLDGIGVLLDERLKNVYWYHLLFFLLFALIDRLIIAQLEERTLVNRGRRIFIAGLSYLREERRSIQELYKSFKEEHRMG